MLYGGPLGTYLSGLSSTSSTPLTSTGSTYTPSTYGSSNYLGSGLRRTSSRYRSSAGGTTFASGSTTTTSGTSLSSYYTPQLRRKYGTNESEAPKTTRYNTTSTRAQPRNSTSPNTFATGSNNHAIIFHYSRWSPNKSSGSSYTGTSISTSASWNSDLSTASNISVDYKRLYEDEQQIGETLRSEIAKAQREMQEVRNQIEAAQQKRRSSDAEQRKLERRISECDEELKTMEQLRIEAERLRAEHRALVRVVARLNREQ